MNVDPLFPPPSNFAEKRPRFNTNAAAENKFTMVYDSSVQEPVMKQLFHGEIELSQLDYKELEKDQDEVFDDDGIELDD